MTEGTELTEGSDVSERSDVTERTDVIEGGDFLTFVGCLFADFFDFEGREITF